MSTLGAELLKLKGSYLYVLPFVIVGFASGVAGVALTLDAHFTVSLDENPWVQFVHGGLVVYVVMLYAPFLILLVSAAYYVEARANAWKLLYVQPVSRSVQYFSKVTLLLLFALMTGLLMLGGLILTGYAVDLLMPEFGFAYAPPEWSKLGRTLAYCFVSGLGIIGLQQLMSLRFRNVLVAPGIGMLAFILALILAATGSKFALFLPYTYPMLATELETFPFTYQTFPVAGISNTELYSIAWFVVSVGLGFIYNQKRDIT